MTHSMIEQQRYFQDHQERHTVLFMALSGNADLWESGISCSILVLHTSPHSSICTFPAFDVKDE